MCIAERGIGLSSWLRAFNRLSIRSEPRKLRLSRLQFPWGTG
jgi:hypothetical protein